MAGEDDRPTEERERPLAHEPPDQDWGPFYPAPQSPFEQATTAQPAPPEQPTHPGAPAPAAEQPPAASPPPAAVPFGSTPPPPAGGWGVPAPPPQAPPPGQDPTLWLRPPAAPGGAAPPAPPGSYLGAPAPGPYASPSPYRADPDNGKAITSMVLGIVSLALFVTSLSFAAPATLVCGIFAWVFGVQARRRLEVGETTRGQGPAKAGLVMGVIGVVLGVLAIAFWTLVIVVGN
jgi:Domain of unknown function (DUF4190)